MEHMKDKTLKLKWVHDKTFNSWHVPDRPVGILRPVLWHIVDLNEGTGMVRSISYDYPYRLDRGDRNQTTVGFFRNLYSAKLMAELLTEIDKATEQVKALTASGEIKSSP